MVASHIAHGAGSNALRSHSGPPTPSWREMPFLPIISTGTSPRAASGFGILT
jgi:hypothetical protein